MKNFYVFFVILCITGQIFAQQFQNPQENFGKYVTWGTVWGDFNNDGYVDLYLSNGLQNYQWEGFLYKNNGDGTFDSVSTAGDIVTEKYVSGGSSWGDYDNDGYLDLYIANVNPGSGTSPSPNSLHTNNGNETFTKETTASVGDIVKTQSTSSGAVAWLDYNNDGFLDAATSNQNVWPGTAASNFLYKSNGSIPVSFTEVTNNFTTTEDTKRAGLTFADFDEDGDMDIFVASGTEYKRNILYVNDGSPDFNFTAVVLLNSGSTDGKPVQGASWGDIDNDGDLDLYLVSGGDDNGNPRANDLFRNDNGTLVHITSGVGPLITDVDFSYASAFGDYDNDGDLDLFVGNDGKYSDGYRCRLYNNDGSGVFTYDNSTTLTIDNDFARSAAWADVDNDGDLDLMMGREGPNRLFINNGNSNNWVEIEAIGDGITTNSKAIGALVKVNATINSNTYTQIRDVSSQSGRGSHNDLRTHFGLGDANKINTASIKWPGPATTNSMTDLPPNKIMRFKQGDLNVSASVIPNQNFMYLFGNTKAAVEFTSNTDGDGGTLTVEKFNSDPGGTFDGSSATNPGGNSVTPNAVVNDRYWSITESGLTGNFTATVYFDASNLPSGLSAENVVILKRVNSSSSWTPVNTDIIGNTIFSTGVNSFSEFAIGYEAKVLVETKIFLEGPYDVNNSIMNTNLNDNDYIPTTSPYSEDVRTISSIPADVVDWVLVELRETFNGTAVASKSALLHKDGRIVNDDASSGVIEMPVSDGNYYIVIKHRNHLAVMSANSVSLNGTTSSLYDFTASSSQFYGTGGAIELETNVWGMISGDADQSGVVDAGDRNATWNDRNKTGYEDSDVDLSGVTDAGDRNITWNNRNKNSQLP